MNLFFNTPDEAEEFHRASLERTREIRKVFPVATVISYGAHEFRVPNLYGNWFQVEYRGDLKVPCWQLTHRKQNFEWVRRNYRTLPKLAYRIQCLQGEDLVYSVKHGRTS